MNPLATSTSTPLTVAAIGNDTPPASPDYASGEEVSDYDSDSDLESQSGMSVRSDDPSEPDFKALYLEAKAKEEARRQQRRKRDAERRKDYRESPEYVAKQLAAEAKKAKQKKLANIKKAKTLIQGMGRHVVAAFDCIAKYQSHCNAARVSAGDDYEPYITTLNNLKTVMDAKATADLTAVVKAAQKASKTKRAAGKKQKQ